MKSTQLVPRVVVLHIFELYMHKMHPKLAGKYPINYCNNFREVMSRVNFPLLYRLDSIICNELR